jgi:hypothetical protein
MFSTIQIEKKKKLLGNTEGKNDGSVSYSAAHNKDRKTSPTADPQKSHLNQHWGEAVPAIQKIMDEANEERAKLGISKIRANSVPAVEVVLGASQEFFEKDNNGDWLRNYEWEADALAWAKNHWKGRGELVQLDIVADERGAPNIKLLFAPITKKNLLPKGQKGNENRVEAPTFDAKGFEGQVQDLRMMKKSFGMSMEKYGLVEGTPGSKSKDKKTEAQIDEETRALRAENRALKNTIWAMTNPTLGAIYDRAKAYLKKSLNVLDKSENISL